MGDARIAGGPDAPPRAGHAWLFDVLFSQSPLVTWAPSGQLPAGFDVAERFAVLPAGRDRSFVVPLTSRRIAAAALTAYNGLRPPRRRIARRAIGLAFRFGAVMPGLRRIDVGTAAGVTGAELTSALLPAHLSGLLGGTGVHMAFGCGGGPYRKPVLQLFDPGGSPLAYVKIGWNGWTRQAVRREADALRACRAAAEGAGGRGARPQAAGGTGAGAAGKRLGVPDLLCQEQWQGNEMIMTSPLPAGVRRPAARAGPDASVVREIGSTAPIWVGELTASQWWADQQVRIRTGLAGQPSAGSLTQIADRIGRRYGHVELPFGRWHGDLVPWNIGVLGLRWYAWDWETSAACAPLGLDALHFHFQVAFVARRAPLPEAAETAARSPGPVLLALGIPADAHDLLAILHLVELALRHEEACVSTGDSDARFYPAVLAELDRRLR